MDRIIEGVEEFGNLGSAVSANTGTELDVARCIDSAKPAFVVLSKI